ncbi:PAS domain-containing sensor histidine kinase [Rufibacter sp. XAAS-G3-1]|uniref:PAS domain-containing sensor histidine kinase n=1 Tax=Rufibacter sp. XAAS-G3-1 TaxID=2729134 RepID=UPI0015E6450A|nr:PAS domain-containing sensor histidine kinase [Rufibacter sp. XAAS-G3-1]
MPSQNAMPDLYLALIEQTGQAFFAYDLGSATCTYRSPAFKTSLKIPAEKMQPAALLALVHPEDQPFVQERLTGLLAKGTVSILEFRIQFPGEQEQWLCLTPALLDTPEGKLLIGHVTEVSAQRQYNDHLKKFSNKKNSVLNILAHDLAGPLGMIQNLSELLTDQLKATDDPETLEILHLIERISKQGTDMLREFMAQEFLESSHTEVISRRVNLVEKMGEALNVYQIIGHELLPKEVTFLPSSEEIYVELDDLKFMQVITNLISNALKFTPDGGIITVTLEEEDTSILIKVADNGVGIPQKYHDTLFDKFTNARRPGLKGERSVGLGMSVVKTIVEWHHGKIWFESEEEKGTTFYIRLPKNRPTTDEAK